jgi:hypothetical protein
LSRGIVKIPLCSTNVIRRVEVTDLDDVRHENPPVLWWAFARAGHRLAALCALATPVVAHPGTGGA